MANGLPNNDCFAYSKTRNICKALDRLYCKNEKCVFYRTQKDNYLARIKAENTAENIEKYR